MASENGNGNGKVDESVCYNCGAHFSTKEAMVPALNLLEKEFGHLPSVEEMKQRRLLCGDCASIFKQYDVRLHPLGAQEKILQRILAERAVEDRRRENAKANCAKLLGNAPRSETKPTPAPTTPSAPNPHEPMLGRGERRLMAVK